MAATSQSQNGSASEDWPGRYYHIDQVLNTPGPRTDPSFLAGDGVTAFLIDIHRWKTYSKLRSGQRLFAESSKDLGYRGRGAWL